ncbi:hypothetical protein VIGAN_05143500, partial [Vigna angularis var. angularis]
GGRHCYAIPYGADSVFFGSLLHSLFLSFPSNTPVNVVVRGSVSENDNAVFTTAAEDVACARPSPTEWTAHAQQHPPQGN